MQMIQCINATQSVTFKNAMVASVATILNSPAIATAPTTHPTMVRQLPTPVPIRMAAPKTQNKTDVSPILPWNKANKTIPQRKTGRLNAIDRMT